MLRLRKRGPPLVQSADARVYRAFMVSAFAGRHGTIDATLPRTHGLAATDTGRSTTGARPAATPSALPFASWFDLFNSWKNAVPLQGWSGLAGAERRLVHQQQRLRKSHRTSRCMPSLSAACALLQRRANEPTTDDHFAGYGGEDTLETYTSFPAALDHG
jgi:hypothetical protein